MASYLPVIVKKKYDFFLKHQFFHMNNEMRAETQIGEEERKERKRKKAHEYLIVMRQQDG
jgi:hypothetical protein